MTRGNPLRLVQVSDTHLSEDRAWFVDNWDAFVNEMRADPPDLIVWTGDVSLRGTHGESDLAFARAEMERLPCPTLVIPGNHDIGEPNPLGPGKPFPNPERERPISESRRRRWRKYFGADWWTRDFGDWRLYGLNGQLIGSGLKAEARQLSEFKHALEDAGDRPGFLFIHKPLFYADPKERTRNLYCVFPQGRRDIIALAKAHKVRVVASGHLHCYRTVRHQGIRMIWSPATAWINTTKKDRAYVAVKRRVGFIEYRLTGRRLAHRLVEPRLFLGHDIRNWSMAYGTTVNLPLRARVPLADKIR